MDFAELERALARLLAGPLPGAAAQALLAPRPRLGWEQGVVPKSCRHGAALLLLYPMSAEPYLVLTLRQAALTHHAGQISLPGGAVEIGESFEAAALREAHEEIGLDPRVVETRGVLSPLHIPISRFVLHPVVAINRERPALYAGAEVERIIEVRLSSLMEPTSLGVETVEREGRVAEIPFFRVDGAKVWGATAMVLAEFLTLVGHPPPSPSA